MSEEEGTQRKVPQETIEETLRVLTLEEQKEIVSEMVRDLLPPDVKKTIVTEATQDLSDADKQDLIVTAAQTLPPDSREEVAAAARGNEEYESTKNDVVVEIAFSPSAYNVIQELMHKGGEQKSLSEVLMDALAFEKWYRDIVAAGGRVLVERGGGDIREVIRYR